MFTQKITTTLSPLKLLKSGERGIVTRLKDSDDIISQKLREMRIAPGSTVILEQRFPRYIIRVGSDRIALSDDLLCAIFVRVV